MTTTIGIDFFETHLAQARELGAAQARCANLEEDLRRERERRIAAEAALAGLRCDNHFDECSEAGECLYPGRGWCRR